MKLDNLHVFLLTQKLMYINDRKTIGYLILVWFSMKSKLYLFALLHIKLALKRNVDFIFMILSNCERHVYWWKKKRCKIVLQYYVVFRRIAKFEPKCQ